MTAFLHPGRNPIFCRVALLFLAVSLSAQEKAVDFNAWYRFPVSVGVEYQSFTPLATYPAGSPYTVSDISFAVRVPIPFHPLLQPSLALGMLRFDSQDASAPLKWDHTAWYGSLGVTYAYRFAKYFELGADLSVGASETVFPDLLPDRGALGNVDLLLGLGGRISLDPTYNFSVEIHPSLKYSYSLGALPDFNGLLFGIGFTGSFRFGQDPDAPGEVIRSIRFERVSVPSAFAAMQSYYARSPLGTVTLVNADSRPIDELEVSFFQKGYMDSPTTSAKIERLNPGERREVPLLALFSDEVFRTEGVTPLSAEVIATYKRQGRPAEQRQAVSFDLYDKKAMTWDDERKVSALITPEDSALKNYAGFIRQTLKDEVVGGYNDPLQLGMEVYQALSEIGVLYQADAELPFTRVQGNPMMVDSVSLARDTLKSGLGDCDDLTVLYDSMLETLAVESGFITTPGHIFSAINTKLPAREYRKIHPDRRMTIEVDGTLWVPVEITLIGKAGFNDAWLTAVKEWEQCDAAPETRGFFVTRKARELYRPVGLKETDLGLQYGSREAIVARFRADRNRLLDGLLRESMAAAKESGRKEDYNRLGMLSAQFGKYTEAEAAFQKALSIDPQYAGAQINRGNVLFLRQKYEEALKTFLAARGMLERRPNPETSLMVLLLVNVSRTYSRLDKPAEAKDSLVQASAVDAKEAQKYAGLVEGAAGGVRASQSHDPATDIVFVEE